MSILIPERHRKTWGNTYLPVLRVGWMQGGSIESKTRLELGILTGGLLYNVDIWTHYIIKRTYFKTISHNTCIVEANTSFSRYLTLKFLILSCGRNNLSLLAGPLWGRGYCSASTNQLGLLLHLVMLLDRRKWWKLINNTFKRAEAIYLVSPLCFVHLLFLIGK